MPAGESVSVGGRRDHRDGSRRGRRRGARLHAQLHDTGGAPVGRCGCRRQSLRHGRSSGSTRRCAPASSSRSRTSAHVARARLRDDRLVAVAGAHGDDPRGAGRQRRRLRPRRPRPVPEHGRDGCRHRRAAGVEEIAVCSPPGPDGDIDPVILAACVLAGAERVYRMGGAQAIAALAYGTEIGRAGRRDRRPRQPVRAGGQAPGLGRVGIDGFAGPSDLLVIADRRLAIRADRARPAGAGRARPGTLVVAVSTRRASCSTRWRGGWRGRRRDRRGRRGWSQVAGSPSRRSTLAEAFAPEHLQLLGPLAEALAPTATHAGCVFVGAQPAPRSATTSPAPTTCCRPAARRASRPACRPRTSGGGSPRCGSPTPARSPAPRRRSPAPRASSSTPSRWRSAIR